MIKHARFLYQPVSPLGKDGRMVTGCNAHWKLCKEAAAEGTVLLKNDGVLPLAVGTKVSLFGIGAGVGQGVGLVLSKVGMTHYQVSIPMGEEMVTDLMPFASTFIRAVTGALGFLLVMGLQKKFHTLATAVRDRKGMNAAVWATVTGPFIGVSLSLMAVQYTEAGIASTLMALTPVFIIWPAYFFFGQQVTFKEIIGACISVAGVSLFFI